MLARVAGYKPGFVAISHKYISFANWAVFLSKSSWLITYSSAPSLSQVTVAAGKKNGFEMIFGSKYAIKWVDTRPKNRL